MEQERFALVGPICESARDTSSRSAARSAGWRLCASGTVSSDLVREHLLATASDGAHGPRRFTRMRSSQAPKRSRFLVAAECAYAPKKGVLNDLFGVLAVARRGGRQSGRNGRSSARRESSTLRRLRQDSPNTARQRYPQIVNFWCAGEVTSDSCCTLERLRRCCCGRTLPLLLFRLGHHALLAHAAAPASPSNQHDTQQPAAVPVPVPQGSIYVTRYTQHMTECACTRASGRWRSSFGSRPICSVRR
jgi:hypothetical protein